MILIKRIKFKVKEVEYEAIHEKKENHEEIMIAKDEMVYAVIKLFPDQEPKAFADNADADVLQAALALDFSETWVDAIRKDSGDEEELDYTK